MPLPACTICVIELIDIFKLCAAVGINLNFWLLMLLIQRGSRRQGAGGTGQAAVSKCQSSVDAFDGKQQWTEVEG